MPQETPYNLHRDLVSHANIQFSAEMSDEGDNIRSDNDDTHFEVDDLMAIARKGQQDTDSIHSPIEVVSDVVSGASNPR